MLNSSVSVSDYSSNLILIKSYQDILNNTLKYHVLKYLRYLLGEYLGISDTIAGMTFLAVANAMPDLVTSIIFVKKKGLIEMAICGAIASNRFAILIGLGFPWALKCVVNWVTNKSYFWNYVPLTSTSLPNTSLVLLVAIVLLFINFRLNNWVLNRKFAFICVSIHLVFVSIAIYLEYTT